MKMPSIAVAITQKMICRRNAATIAASAIWSSVRGFAFAIAVHVPQPGDEIGRGRSNGQEAGQDYERGPKRAESRRKGKLGQHDGGKDDLHEGVGFRHH